MRYRSRHVHETVKQHVIASLTAAGWVDAPVNFGTTPVTVVSHQPLEAGETPPPNTVAVTMGDTTAQDDEELGGGLQSLGYTVFVDVWGEREGISVSIADDVREALVNKIIALKDFTSSTAGVATDDTIEFVDVILERPEVATTTVDKRTWRVVKATAVCYFLD